MKTLTQNKTWMALRPHDHQEFQRIVSLLVDFDEKTGRYKKYGDPASHHMRKSVAQSDPNDLVILVGELGNAVYHVVVSVQSAGGSVVTGWVHEDGIRSERDGYKDDATHPVHSIVCLTDLVERATVADIEAFGLRVSSASDILKGDVE